MNISEFKKAIEENTLSDNQVILKLTDDSSWFIAKQYIKRISELKNLKIKYVDSTADIPKSTGFVDDDNLYICKVDELKEYDVVDNSILVCNKTNKKNDVIVIPALERWQFIDYIKTIVPGLSDKDLEWLSTQYEFTYNRETKMKYFRFYNDMLKLSIFPKPAQQRIFEDLYEAGEYKDLSALTIFDLSNALLRNDAKKAKEVLSVFEFIDSKPYIWLLSILLNNFRKVIDIQFNPNITAKDLGMSDKQFYVIKKYNCNIYSHEKLIDIYKMLTSLEYKYKFEGLPIDKIPQYIVFNILGG